MATIRKRTGKKTTPNGSTRKTTTWQAVVRRGDHKPQYRSFNTKGEAQAWAASVENAINRDEFAPDHPSKVKTVTDLLERYRTTKLTGKLNRRNDDRHIDFWIDQMGTYRIAQITRAQVIEIRDSMVTSRAPATVNRYLATLRHAWGIAETDWEWATSNPLKSIKLKEPRGRDRHLSNDEIKALLAAAKDCEHPHLYPLVLTALTTGARRGELMGLRWGDVDIASRRLLLRETKNADKRVLALVPQVIDEFRTLRKIRRIDTDLVFANPNGNKRTYSNLEVAWRSVRSSAGLDDFWFHDLRHTFASRMAMEGKSLREIAEALGHRTLAMVQRYSHLTDSHVHSAMEQTARGILGE